MRAVMADGKLFLTTEIEEVQLKADVEGVTVDLVSEGDRNVITLMGYCKEFEIITPKGYADHERASSFRTDEFRIESAANQLIRYGKVANSGILDMLDMLTDLNDDLAHGRHRDVISNDFFKMRAILDKMSTEVMECQPQS